jgi:hypothetical protein
MEKTKRSLNTKRPSRGELSVPDDYQGLHGWGCIILLLISGVFWGAVGWWLWGAL